MKLIDIRVRPIRITNLYKTPQSLYRRKLLTSMVFNVLFTLHKYDHRDPLDSNYYIIGKLETHLLGNEIESFTTVD